MTLNPKFDHDEIQSLRAEVERLTALVTAEPAEAVTVSRSLLLDLEAKMKAQAAQIEELKAIAANLASHLEAIQHITERDDMSDHKTARAIRQHCEAANVMEAV